MIRTDFIFRLRRGVGGAILVFTAAFWMTFSPLESAEPPANRDDQTVKTDQVAEETARLGKTPTEEDESSMEANPAQKAIIAEGVERLLDAGSSAGERRTCRINGIEYAFRWAPPGSFMKGSPMDETGRPNVEPPWRTERQTPVTIDHGFWMMETELTRAAWQSVMDYDLCHFTTDLNLPQEMVSWEHIQEFCGYLTAGTGIVFAPPTEEEWEYAARAGSNGAYAGTGNLDEMGWFLGNSDQKTHPVAEKRPNAWGFYDVHGNVWEYCQGIRLRGGCWDSEPSGCRAAVSGFVTPWFRDRRVGVRLMIRGREGEGKKTENGR